MKILKGKIIKGFTREEHSWILYDSAYSAFAAIMLVGIFPAFFMYVAGGEGTPGSAWWGFGNSGARLLLAVAAPLIGAIIEYKGYKKRLFVIFLSLGILAHLFLAAPAHASWQYLLIWYIVANIFWSASIFIYDSYLPDITTPERMDYVSAAAYGWGYICGSTIPFLAGIALIVFGEHIGIDFVQAVRLSILITAVWWGAQSIPMIRDVTHKHQRPKPDKGLMKESTGNALSTARKIIKNKPLFLFIVAYFFYIDGVGTVMTMAVVYGAELGLDQTLMILAIVVTQFVAFPCSILFGKWSKKTGPVNLILVAIMVYFAICTLGFFMGFGLEQAWFGSDVGTILFFVLAILVGTVQGGIQALSRSCYGRLIPADQSGEYFGFYEIFTRFSAILGPALYGVILVATGRPSVSILSTIVLFTVGFILLLINRKNLTFPSEPEPQEETPSEV